MKGLIIISLLIATLFPQQENKIKITPDKKVYTQGEIITFKVKATKRFQLATDGDCSSSILPPHYIKEKDGVFKSDRAFIQKCCGLPCAGSFKNYEFTRIDTLSPGRWKVLLYTCDYTSGPAESEVFEVVE